MQISNLNYTIMKNSVITIVLFLLSAVSYAQPIMSYDDEYDVKKTFVKPVKITHCPDGFAIVNDKVVPMVIVLDNKMTFTVSEGIFIGEKKLLNQNEISTKLQSMISAKSKLIATTILVNNYKPYLISHYENTISKSKETIIIPLVEENNYLKMQGTPVKQITVGGKKHVIVYEIIETKVNDYVGHLALLK